MGHRQKQKFSTVVTELKKSQEGLEKKFTLLGNAVITADSANKEDKKYFRGIAIATNEMLGEMDGHKTKLEELEVFHKVSIDNYAELTYQVEFLEKYVNALMERVSSIRLEFEDLKKSLEWALRIICVIVGVFLLACISGVF